MRARFAVLAPVPALLAALAGCAPDYSPNTYDVSAVQKANKVEQGVIIGVRQVAVTADGTIATVSGGAAGGIVGAQVPGGGASTALGALGGSVVGGLVGSAAAHSLADTTATEYIVRKANGELLSVTQKDTTPLALGQKVLVITGTQARVVADYTVPPEPKVATLPPAGASPAALPPLRPASPAPPPAPAPSPPPVMLPTQ
mgnify:CR=1 FL=1